MTEWTNWRTLAAIPPIRADVLREILDGGQAFRWTRKPEGEIWQGTWGQHHARIRLTDKNRIEASVPAGRNHSFDALALYLGSDIDWEELESSLPWRSDPHLHRCMSRQPGLRLLRQPFAETLLAFLCSATKQIPQIKLMCENLAAQLGSEIVPGVNALPTWPQIAEADESDLRALKLGFRARNIKRAASQIADQPDLLAEIEAAPYLEAKARLTTLAGVGEKIADCALLFGARQFEAFPVDTWIIKVLQRRYGLEEWNNKQLAQFGRIHFGEYAGFAQQFLFAWEREQARSSTYTTRKKLC